MTFQLSRILPNNPDRQTPDRQTPNKIRIPVGLSRTPPALLCGFFSFHVTATKQGKQASVFQGRGPWIGTHPPSHSCLLFPRAGFILTMWLLLWTYSSNCKPSILICDLNLAITWLLETRNAPGGGGNQVLGSLWQNAKAPFPTFHSSAVGGDDELSPTTSVTWDTVIPACAGVSLHQIQRDLGLHVRSV